MRPGLWLIMLLARFSDYLKANKVTYDIINRMNVALQIQNGKRVEASEALDKVIDIAANYINDNAV